MSSPTDSSHQATIFSPQTPSRRKRAREDSSEERDEQFISDYLFDVDPYRVAHPHRGVVWPYHDLNIPPNTPFHGVQVSQDISSIMNHNAISISAGGTYFRSRYPNKDQVPTVVVQTTSQDPTTWSQAAQEAYTQIQTRFGTKHVRFQVEICNPDLMNCDFSFAVPGSNPATRVYEAVRDQIAYEADRQVRGRWVTIGLYYRTPQISEDTGKATILISYAEGSEAKWARKLRDLRAIVAKYQDVELEVAFTVGQEGSIAG